MQKTNEAPSLKDLRVFALIFAIGFLIIGWVIPALKDKAMNPYLVGLAVFVFLLGMLIPKSLIIPRKYWIKFGNVMGKINSTILFTVIYFLVFATIGLIFRIFKRDRLKMKFRGVNSTMVMKNEISPFDEPF